MITDDFKTNLALCLHSDISYLGVITDLLFSTFEEYLYGEGTGIICFLDGSTYNGVYALPTTEVVIAGTVRSWQGVFTNASGATVNISWLVIMGAGQYVISEHVPDQDTVQVADGKTFNVNWSIEVV